LKEDKKSYPTTGHSDKFTLFLEKELQPFVQSKFKTNQSKTIIGQSLGGLLATEILFKKPGLFNKYLLSVRAYGGIMVPY
jgi:predicted alpha/beta superfamily hydrolase